MISKCSNPECASPFDYREGRLVRISTLLVNKQTPAHQCVIEHFWLCGKCAALKLRHQDSSRQSLAESVSLE